MPVNEFRSGWRLLLAATLGTMCGLITVTNYSQGFFVGPVTAEFGWSKAQFFLGFTVMMVTGIVTAPVIGVLADRIGARKLAIAGLIGHALAYVILSLNTGSLVLWYASFVLLAVMGAGSLPIIWTKFVNGWFQVNRGKAIGITMAGTGIGAFLLPPIVQGVIAGHGWRTAYQVIGVGAAVLALPIVLAWLRERSASGTIANAPTPADWGITPAVALRMRQFWVLGALLFLTVFVVVGILSNFEQMLILGGLGSATIAGLAALMGATVIVGRLLIGVLVDRFWAPGVGIVFFSLPILAILLMLSGDLTTGKAAFVAIAMGLAAGAELDLLSYLTSRYFGTAHYGAIFGRIFAFFTVGAGLAPPVFGGSADANGGYSPVLGVSIAILLACIALFAALGRYPAQSERHQHAA
ncbi:MAG: hypothetical protein RLZZ563_1282 [Pseudomonadota bacterium]|jgi:MFS family permease